jgi:hypothetical protein
MHHMMSPAPANGAKRASGDAAIPHAEQVRLMVLGMEERLRVREEKLVKAMEKADQESHKFESLRKDAQAAKT